MHIVTKFLVVVAAVLGILLSGLSIAYSANVQRVKDEYADLSARITGLEATHAAALAQQAAEREQALQQLAAKNAQLTSLTAELTNLRSDRDDLLSEVNQLRLAEGLYTTQVDEMTAVLATYAQLDEAQSQELSQLRAAQLEAGRKEIALSDRINDLQSELEVMQESNRALQVQIAEIVRRASDELAGAAQSGTFQQAPVSLRAQVSDVAEDASGRTYVSINAGSSDLLSERMELNVVRNGRYIGSIVLQQVDLNESAGLFDAMGTGSSPQTGDLVLPQLY